MGKIQGYMYTSIYYCCKSFPLLLHDVMAGGWNRRPGAVDCTVWNERQGHGLDVADRVLGLTER